MKRNLLLLKKQQEKKKKLKTANFKETQSNIKKEPANSSLQRNDINADEDNKKKNFRFFSKFLNQMNKMKKK